MKYGDCAYRTNAGPFYNFFSFSLLKNNGAFDIINKSKMQILSYRSAQEKKKTRWLKGHHALTAFSEKEKRSVGNLNRNRSRNVFFFWDGLASSFIDPRSKSSEAFSFLLIYIFRINSSSCHPNIINHLTFLHIKKRRRKKKEGRKRDGKKNSSIRNPGAWNVCGSACVYRVGVYYFPFAPAKEMPCLKRNFSAQEIDIKTSSSYHHQKTFT